MTGAILNRIARGESQALRECIDTYGALVWSLARRLSRTPADAEDAVQEIFLQLWTQANRFDNSKGSEQTFIAMIARRRLIDRLRKSRAEQLADVDLENLMSSAWTDSSNGSETGAEMDQAIQALQELPFTHRRVIELGCVYGFTQMQIATHTGLPLGTVKSYMRRGLLTLRLRLNGEARSVSRAPGKRKPVTRFIPARQLTLPAGIL